MAIPPPGYETIQFTGSYCDAVLQGTLVEPAHAVRLREPTHSLTPTPRSAGAAQVARTNDGCGVPIAVATIWNRLWWRARNSAALASR